jgi:hypothetical protein
MLVNSFVALEMPEVWRTWEDGVAVTKGPYGLFNDENELLRKAGIDSQKVAAIKGYGSGMEKANHYARLAVESLEDKDVNVLIVDGDWYKADSFTHAAYTWLQGSNDRKLVLVKPFSATKPPKKLIQSWLEKATTEELKRITLVFASEKLMDKKEAYIRKFDTTHNVIKDLYPNDYEQKLNESVLGLITIGCLPTNSLIVSVGGGPTAYNELRFSVNFWKQGGPMPNYRVILATRKGGKESNKVMVDYWEKELQANPGQSRDR